MRKISTAALANPASARVDCKQQQEGELWLHMALRQQPQGVQGLGENNGTAPTSA